MDLAIYINELLGLQGEVNVPGIGYFAQKRINGYYDEHENKFYPPRHEITFDPESRDDEGLAAYISNKKNISQASAKYFIEKYASGLKQQASEQHTDITGLGKLYYEYSALNFKADKKFEENDPSFYGFSPVKTHKGGKKAVIVETSPVTVAPHALKMPVEEQKPVVIPPTIEDTPSEETAEQIAAGESIVPPSTFVPPPVYVEEPPDHRARNIWIVILLVVIIVLLLFGIAYQYNPGLFSPNAKEDTTVVVKTLPAAAKADSATKKDTSAKSLAPIQTIKPAIDTFAVKHYDVSGGSFASLAHFNDALKNYTSLGLHPEIAKQAGSQHQINLGTFFNYADAKRTRDSILNIKGINKTRIFIQTYIPKK